MSFLANFMRWNSGTEVPEQYYFWSGIATLAALTNGRVYINMGRYEIYPNLYIILLGPPANGKTSAMRRSEEIIRQFPDTPISAQSETPEGLIRFMRDACVLSKELKTGVVQYTPVSCFLPELSNFFGKDAAGMIDILTGIWDCNGRDFHRRTKGQGEDKLPSPFINVLGCTTQAWITQYLKADIVGGGFTRRVIFVNEMMTDDTNRVAWPIETPEQMQARENCIRYGAVLKTLTGQMQYGDGARLWWDKWYTTRKISREEDIRGYDKTKPANLLKVATLVALSRAPELVVTVEDLEVALALLDKTEAHLNKVFQAIGRNELNVIANQALNYLEQTVARDFDLDNLGVRKYKVMAEAQLRGLLSRNVMGREFDDLINHLVASEKILKRSIVLNGITRVVIVLREESRPS